MRRGGRSDPRANLLRNKGNHTDHCTELDTGNARDVDATETADEPQHPRPERSAILASYRGGWPTRKRIAH